jgi:hypothetical protein
LLEHQGKECPHIYTTGIVSKEKGRRWNRNTVSLGICMVMTKKLKKRNPWEK